MKIQPSSPHSSSRGQSLLEFAISLTFMLILLAGAVDFGIGLFHYTVMRDAAQEGALYGSMNPTDTAAIRSRIANASGATGMIKRLYDDGLLGVTITVVEGGTPCEGKGLRVTLTYDYPISMPFVGGFIGSDHIALRAMATDTILTPPCP